MTKLHILIAGLGLGWAMPVLALPVTAAKSSPGPLAAPAAVATPAAGAFTDASAPVAQPIAIPASLTPERQAVLREQVALDRADFSPGVIDGRDGSNFEGALTAYKAAHGGAEPTLPNAPLPVVRYTIQAEDETGPFAPVPHDLAEMAKMTVVGYRTPLEGLAERFHADQALLKELNPGADFTKAGDVIAVPDVAVAKIDAKVAKIEVDKTHDQVRAYGADGTLLALFPATVGSTERPAPTGTYKVIAFAPHATYTHDPRRLTFGNKEGKVVVPAGPNNPVGGVWISLSKPTYGIHGSPDPTLVGKRASHGCVRLTNWDARALGKAVNKGTTVVFLGSAERKT
jgi:lipoprotein-anchoring transpeptidase ErfK/SrfK